MNWSGSLRFEPAVIETPRSEEELRALIRRCADSGRRVRVVAAGHSSSPLVETSDVLLSLKHFQSVDEIDRKACHASVGAGMTLKAAGEALHEAGLAFHNLGDVDVQTVVGAIATGTHGSGVNLQNLATMLVGGRMLKADGEVESFSIESAPEFVRAARCSLGVLGIYTSVRLQLLPAYRLERREWCGHIEDCLANLDQLFAENRNFDFYWYPRSDEAKLRTLNPPGHGTQHVPFARCMSAREGWSHEVIPKSRHLKFDEMEYALPAENGPACFRTIRQRVKARHRNTVAWRVLYRAVAADDAFLSPAHARDTVTISLHHNAGLPFDAYFNDIEPVFREHGGRPHWGKKHSMTGRALRSLYPCWDQFSQLRRQYDPNELFLTPYLRELLDVQT